jgi:hypothetical protein
MSGKREKDKSLAIERRESPRWGMDFPARFRVISGDSGRVSKEILGAVKNLSESGFCLATNFTIVEDLHVLASSSGVSENILEIRITFPDDKELALKGLACWYDLNEAGGPYRYNVGIRITEISPDNRTDLRTYLRNERKAKMKSFGRKWLGRLLRLR